MNDLRHMLEDNPAVRIARAGGFSRRRSIARRLTSRVLPGGMVVVAALTMPELSVGAGDLARGDHFDDPPLPPPSLKQAPTARLGAARARPGLAGVRYAPIIDLERAPVLTLPVTMALPAPREGDTSVPAHVPVAASLPGKAVPPPALVMPLVVPTIDSVQSAGKAAPVAAFAPQPVSSVAASLSVPTALPPTASELAAAAVPLTTPEPAVPDRPVQVSTAVAASALVQFESATATTRIAAVSAPVPVDRGADPVSTVAVPTALLAPAPATASVAPQLSQQPVAGLRAPLAAPSPARAPASAVAAVPQFQPALSAPLAAANSPFPIDVKSQLITRIDGKTAGAVDFRQTPEGLELRLGSVAEVLADRFAADEIARIRASSAGNAYVSLADLQAKGIPISYDPVYDEFNVGLTDTRPKSARKVHIDQIATPERGIDATGMAQVPRPR